MSSASLSAIDCYRRSRGWQDSFAVLPLMGELVSVLLCTMQRCCWPINVARCVSHRNGLLLPAKRLGLTSVPDCDPSDIICCFYALHLSIAVLTLQRHERHRSLTHSGLLFSRINVQFHPVSKYSYTKWLSECACVANKVYVLTTRRVPHSVEPYPGGM